MMYYILEKVSLQNAHGYKIIRGVVEYEEGNIVMLDTARGAICCHRSQLLETFESAREMARILISESYGEEL